MNPLQADPYTAHHETFLMLPWYVNNTLRGAERHAVERHLNICLTCRRELENLQKLSVAVNRQRLYDPAAFAPIARVKNWFHLATAPTDPALEAIFNPQRKQPDSFSQERPNFGRSKVAMVAVIVLSMLVPGYWVLDKLLRNDYRTLSAFEVAKPPRNDIWVLFSKGANHREITSILTQVHGQIVAGPSEQAVYTVRINTANTAKSLLETIEQLRKNRQILFAEPAYAPHDPDQSKRDTHL